MIEDAKVSSSVSSNGSVKVHAHESDKLLKDLSSSIQAKDERIVKLEAKVKKYEFGFKFFGYFASSKITMSIDEFVKMLKSIGVHIGKNKFLETLRNEGYLEHDSNKKNQPTSKSTGLFEFKKNAKKSTILMLTAKGT